MTKKSYPTFKNDEGEQARFSTPRISRSAT
jgi:hypothetical protein